MGLGRVQFIFIKDAVNLIFELQFAPFHLLNLVIAAGIGHRIFIEPIDLLIELGVLLKNLRKVAVFLFKLGNDVFVVLPCVSLSHLVILVVAAMARAPTPYD